MKDAILLDAQPSMRRKDANGYLHIAITPISKACVNPYLGREIAGSEAQGWDANTIYYGLRDPDELQKAAKTFDGMPLLMNHHKTDAENPAKEYTIGSIGTDGKFEKPYLKNSMTITDAKAIQAIEDGSSQEISCSYRFTPDFTSGDYIAEDGSKIHYDFIMRNIEGNHVALVPEGRAGHDVKVADSKLELNDTATPKERRTFMPLEFEELIDAIMPNASVEDKALAMAKLDELGSVEAEADDAKAKDEEKDIEEDYDAEEEVLDDEDLEEEEEEADDDNIDELLKDPKAKRAFEYGVRYGEKREKSAPKRLDKEHERKGMEKAEDSMEAIQDAMLEKFRSINAAAVKVRPLVGEIDDPLAFDSAEAIYAFALDKNGVDIESYPVEAYEGMVDMKIASRPSYQLNDSALDEDCADEMSDFMKALNGID